MQHVSVLTSEVIELSNIRGDSVVVDATFGAGGHARAILSHLGEKGIYVGIDADDTAFNEIRSELESYKATVHLVHENFRNIDTVLTKLNIETVDYILADLGWRKDQFTSGNKGFSFLDDSPLLMTYGDPKAHLFTAVDIVNDWDEEHIADIIYGYGEERASRTIARAIVAARTKAPIISSKELADLIVSIYPKKGNKGIHPATRTFQALRMAVNDELGALEEFLEKGFTALSSEARMAVISFHSLEDRLVKQQFRTYVKEKRGALITKKPITPTQDEVHRNVSARSAKLRVIEKI